MEDENIYAHRFFYLRVLVHDVGNMGGWFRRLTNCQCLVFLKTWRERNRTNTQPVYSYIFVHEFRLFLFMYCDTPCFVHPITRHVIIRGWMMTRIQKMICSLEVLREGCVFVILGFVADNEISLWHLFQQKHPTAYCTSTCELYLESDDTIVISDCFEHVDTGYHRSWNTTELTTDMYFWSSIYFLM